MTEVKLFRHYAHLHFIVILLGFTAILGALISIDAIPLVWFRMFFAAVGLFIYLKYKKINLSLTLKEQIHLYAIGLLVALHWVTFFHAIKVSNVSVTLGVFASTTLFTSFLEPFLQKRKVLWLEVLIGLVIIGGIYLIFQYETEYVEGILFSLLSALLNGLFVVLNRNISRRWNPALISFYEMIGGFLGISLFFIFSGTIFTHLTSLDLHDFIWILILGFLCTSYAFAAIVEIMKELSAYTVVLAVNLEPVYGIILAFFIFGEAERMSGGFYLGTLVILISVFSYPYLKRKVSFKKF
ncbi:MAG: DMT family transporter [Bacteroidetes bacterium]|nr:MAG: DMT family transporter [Bacteroidota bacterium]